MTNLGLQLWAFRSIIFLIFAICVVGIVSGQNNSQIIMNYDSKKTAPLFELVHLKGDIYLVKGGWGANVGFAVGPKGVLVIDSKATKDASKRVIAEIQKITRLPIATIVYTHSDPDSFNGRDAYPDSAESICSLKILEDWEKNTTVYLEADAPASIYQPWPASYFTPELTFTGQLNLHLGDEKVELHHYGQAHTSGDTIIVFPGDRLAFIGDLVFPGREPMIQDQKGGYTGGLLRTLTVLLSLKPEIRTFIPSHGDPIGREEIKQTIRTIEIVSDRVKTLFDAGRSLDEIKKEFGVRTPPSEPGLWVWPSLAATVFRELSERQTK